MLIVGLTESSARFISGIIAFLIVVGFFGWLSQATGVHPFILIGIFVSVFAAFIILLFKGSLSNKKGGLSKENVTSELRCCFIRANGSQCVKAKGPSSDYCGHHAAKMEIVTPEPTAIVRVKRSQCGFVKDDGSKCRKLKPVEIRRCIYHLKSEEESET